MTPQNKNRVDLFDEEQDDDDCFQQPIPAYTECLLLNNDYLPCTRSGDSNDNRWNDSPESTVESSFTSLFTLPKCLSNPSTLRKALNTAQKNNQRWLLVNIQDDHSFESYRLNRDVWKSESVQAVIATYFSFWQRSRNHPDGQEVTHLYQVSSFPFIGALESRTGFLAASWKGKKFADEFSAASELLDFVDKQAIVDADLKSGPQPNLNVEVIDITKSDQEDEHEAKSATSEECIFDESQCPSKYLGRNNGNDQKDISCPKIGSLKTSASSYYSDMNETLKALHEERARRNQ